MHSLMTLVSILAPLFIGFCVRLPARYTRLVNQLLTALVYVILLLIGMSLAKVGNLGAQIGLIAQSAALLCACVLGSNLLVLMWFDRCLPWTGLAKRESSAQQSVSLMCSIKQVGCVAAGLVLGLLLPRHWLPPEETVSYALILLILLVGIQLRSSGISLRRVLINRRGVQTSLYFMASCLCAGLLFAALTPDVSWSKGLALSSGYGWYSLSSVVMTQAYGAIWGSVALLNDLARELFALLFIPLLMHRHPSAAVGIGGATSLDFTLPVIQSSGGVAVVSLAISFGFIVNIVSPILMVLFATMHF